MQFNQGMESVAGNITPKTVGIGLFIIGFLYLPVKLLATATGFFPSIHTSYHPSLLDAITVCLMGGVGCGFVGWFGMFCYSRLADQITSMQELFDKDRPQK